MKIIFFGTPKFAAIILGELIKWVNTSMGQLVIEAVITQPSRPVGRRQILTTTPVKVLAQKHKIQVFDFTSIIYIIEVLRKLKPDLIVVAAYGPPFLTKEILELPKYGCLNIHPSLLPKYRGASPIPYAILNGERETGVTIFKMTEKIDQGPIIIREALPILGDDTTETLTDRLARFGAKLLLKTLKYIILYRRPPVKYYQNHSKATYARKLKKDDGFIRFETLKRVLKGENVRLEELPPFIQEQIQKNNLTIKQFNPKGEQVSFGAGNEVMHNFIRAFYPWPVIWTILPNKKRLKLLKSHLEDGEIHLDEVQLEGRKSSPDSKFIDDFF